MNGHFPEPYPNELLYSVLARLGARLGQLSWQDYGANLLGAKTATGIIELPNRLDCLVRSMPPEFGSTADQLIDKNTLWPFYSAFLPPDRRLRTREEMKGKGQPRVLLGLISLRGPSNEWLRYCPECVMQDRRKFREAYWHRSHQIPGTRDCAEHGVLLVDSAAAVWHRSNRHAYCAAEDAIPQSFPSSVPGTEFHRAIATDCVWLLEHPEARPDPLHLKERYRSQLIELSLANHRGTIHMEEFHLRFVHEIGLQQLKEIGISVPEPRSPGQSWLASAVRTPTRTPAPIRHILILRFLQINIRTIHLPVKPCTPFGEGPWPCLNHASNHYGAATITSVNISATHNGRSLRGVFSCPSCEMTYERLGPDTVESDRFRRDRIPVYGRLWEQRIQELWQDTTISLRQLSIYLGVDPNTVIRQVKRLGLHRLNSRPTTVRWEAITFTKPEEGPRRNPEEYNAEWVSLRNQYPRATTTELRKLAPAVYAFLRRHQLEWLNSHLPCQEPRPYPKPHVDWTARDSEVVKLVRLAGQALVDANPPVRLTIKALLYYAGWPSLTSKSLRHMPQTQELLVTLRENQFQFAVRRIKNCATRLSGDGQLSYRKLLADAKIKPVLLQSHEVRDALIQSIVA